MPEFFDFGKKTAEFLLSCQRPDGAINDPESGKRSPENHYAETFFALACLNIYKTTGDRKWLDAAKRALACYFNIPQSRRGHAEFNSLALLLSMKNCTDAETSEMILRHTKELKYSAHLGKNCTNNWLAIKLVCIAMQRNNFMAGANEPEEKKILAHLLSVQLEDGFFYDYPQKQGNEGVATPLCYHAKICLMLLLYSRETGNKDALNAAVNGLESLKEMIAPDGEAFYYGRSTNSLFAYACGMLASATAAGMLAEKNRRKSLEFSACAGLLLSFAEKMQDKNGFTHISPGGNREAYDGYMHLPVYCAYAAGMLTLPGNKKGNGKIRQKKFFYAKDSGFLVAREKGNFIAFQLRGQSVDGMHSLFNDTRYYGMNLLCFKKGGKDICAPTPHAENAIENRYRPLLQGFIPVAMQGRTKITLPLF